MKQRNILDQITTGRAGLKKTTQKITSQSKQKDAVRNELKNRRKAIAGGYIDSSDADTDSDDSESIFD